MINLIINKEKIAVYPKYYKNIIELQRSVYPEKFHQWQFSLILMSRSWCENLSQSNERNPSRSRGKFLSLLSPHFTPWRTKDGPIARFIATLKRTYLLWSRCSSWQIELTLELRNFVTRVQARIGRNRCTSFPNAPTSPSLTLCI